MLRVECIITHNLVAYTTYTCDVGSNFTIPFNFMCRYHLRDIVVGKIYFLLVRIKIKHMEMAIIKKETSGTREYETMHSELRVQYFTLLSSR